MQEALPWMFNSQPGNDDREGFLQEIMGMAPPQMLSPMIGLLSSTAEKRDWAEMVKRIPELKTLGTEPPPG